MCNAEGISEEDVNKLQTELRKMAADLVGEVSYTCTALVCLTYSVPHSFFIVVDQMYARWKLLPILVKLLWKEGSEGFSDYRWKLLYLCIKIN